MISAVNYCARYFATDEGLMKNRPETENHICIPLQSLLADHHLVCRGNGASSKKPKKSGVLMTDYMLSERITNIYSKMLFIGI